MHKNREDLVRDDFRARMKSGDLRGALKLLQQEAALLQNAASEAGRFEYALLRMSEGGFFLQLGELGKARQSCEAALSIFRDLGQSEYVRSASASLAEAERRDGFVGFAWERFCELEEELSGLLHPNEIDVRTRAMVLNNLGGICLQRADYDSAEKFMTTALNLLESRRVSEPMYANALSNLSQVYRLQGFVSEATQLLQRAITHLDQTDQTNHPIYSTCVANYAALLAKQGYSEQARELLEARARFVSGQLGPVHPQSLLLFNNLSHFCTPHRAEVLLVACDRMIRDHTRYDPFSHQAILQNLGDLYIDAGRLSDALPVYYQLLEIRTGIYGDLPHPDLAESLTRLALCKAVATTAPYAFLDDLAQAAHIEEAHANRFFPVLPDRASIALAERLWQSVAISVSACRQNKAIDRDGVKVWLYERVLRRKGLMLEGAKIRSQVLKTAPQANQQKLWEERQQILSYLANLLYNSPDAGKIGQAARLSEAADRIERELIRAIPGLKLSIDSGLTVENVKTALPPDALFLEFCKFRIVDISALRTGNKAARTAYLAFIMSKDSLEPDLVELPSDAETIDALVWKYLAGLGGEQNPNTELTDELWEAVGQPLVSWLSRAKRLLIAPDGALNWLPFELLIGRIDARQGRRYLSRQGFRISYVTSGRELIDSSFCASDATLGPPLVICSPEFDLDSSFCASDATLGPPLVICSPEFDLSSEPPVGKVADPLRRTRFNALEFSAREGAAVASLLRTTCFSGREAKAEALLSCRSPRIVHLSTHGIFGFELSESEKKQERALQDLMSYGEWTAPGVHPLTTMGLVFAGGQIATALQIADTDLRRTELVVLAACQTGLGQAQPGEGAFGLRRAFFQAGAKSVVVSLWNVDDRLTADLMREFYRRLMTGEGRLEALLNAQEYMRSIGAPARIWGAFVLYGQTGPLTTPPI